MTLRERKLIERAKGILMSRRHLNENEAFRLLQRQSQDRRIPMAKLAESIIQTDELLEAPSQSGNVAPQTDPTLANRAARRRIMFDAPAILVNLDNPEFEVVRQSVDGLGSPRVALYCGKPVGNKDGSGGFPSTNVEDSASVPNLRGSRFRGPLPIHSFGLAVHRRIPAHVKPIKVGGWHAAPYSCFHH